MTEPVRFQHLFSEPFPTHLLPPPPPRGQVTREAGHSCLRRVEEQRETMAWAVTTYDSGTEGA